MARNMLFTNETDLYDESEYLGNEDVEELRSMAVDAAYDDLKDRLSEIPCGRVLVFARLGLWNGLKNGYGNMWKGDTLAKVLDVWSRDDDIRRLYVEDGELKAEGVHHDGTNTYLLREFTGDEDDLDDFEFYLYEKGFNFEDENVKKEIDRLTVSLAPRAA